MTTTPQMKMILKNELEQLKEQEKIAEDSISLDIDLQISYRDMVNRYKKIITVASSYLEELNVKSQTLAQKNVVLEQKNFNLKKKNLELYNMCAYDSLTGVKSRKFLMEEL